MRHALELDGLLEHEVRRRRPRLLPEIRGPERRESHDQALRKVPPNLEQQFQPLDVGQQGIEQEQVRSQPKDLTHNGGAVGLTDDVPVLGEMRAQDPARQRVLIDDELRKFSERHWNLSTLAPAINGRSTRTPR